MALQHFRTREPISSLSVGRASEDRCRGLRKRRPQGLATLTTVSASHVLGSVSQPPTLLGFALQSFPPFPGSEDSFESTFPLLRFPAKPVRALHRRSSGLLSRKRPCPDALRRVSSKWGPMLSWALRPLRFSPLPDPYREPLPHHITLSFLKDRPLTMPALMNLRALRPGNSGFFPEGTPTYLVFCTGCVCHLFGR